MPVERRLSLVYGPRSREQRADPAKRRVDQLSGLDELSGLDQLRRLDQFRCLDQLGRLD